MSSDYDLPWEDPFKEMDEIFEKMRERIEKMMHNGHNDPGVIVRSWSWSSDDAPKMLPTTVQECNGPVPVRSIPAPEQEPLIDVREKDDRVMVLVQLPGVSKEDVEVEVIGQELRLEVDTERCQFQRQIALPCAVQAKGVEANYRNGVLEVTLHKRAPRRRKGVKVPVS